jgi:hypothetical protein
MTDDLDTTFVAVVCAYFLSPSWFTSPVLFNCTVSFGSALPSCG